MTEQVFVLLPDAQRKSAEIIEDCASGSGIVFASWSPLATPDSGPDDELEAFRENGWSDVPLVEHSDESGSGVQQTINGDSIMAIVWCYPTRCEATATVNLS